MKRFSKRYKKFESWFSVQDRQNAYTRRISRLHSLYPTASLEQLRGHSRQKSERLSKSKPVPLHKRAWDSLSPHERLTREKTLAVLSEARRLGQSLTKLSKEHRIRVKLVLQATNGFKKVRGRWKAKRRDSISRVMIINEKGREVFIEVTDSRYASLIGRYHSAVKEYLNTGDISALLKFKGKRVKDSSGKFHTLETNPKAVREINERKEEPEFPDVYKSE
jgi:hypothetical protein